jgi:hypothetical protein
MANNIGKKEENAGLKGDLRTEKRKTGDIGRRYSLYVSCETGL